MILLKVIRPSQRTNMMSWKTIGFICQWVDDCVFHHIASETNAQTLSIYRRVCISEKTTRIRYFIKKYVNLKFKDGRSVAECLTEFHSLVNQLTTGEDGIRW